MFNMRTPLLFISLSLKRAGVGMGFRSVLMLAMTDLNLCKYCTHVMLSGAPLLIALGKADFRSQTAVHLKEKHS